MVYSFVPSLAHIAQVKIVVVLWSEYDIHYLYSPSASYSSNVNQVLEKVLMFPLPDRVKNSIKGFIRPIGVQMSSWLKFHKEFRGFITKSTDFCWTGRGTIDREKTACRLVWNEHLNIVERFNLACIYCLEDKIYELCERLISNVPVDLKSRISHTSPLVSFWYRHLGEGLTRLIGKVPFVNEHQLNISCNSAFLYSVVTGNVSAIRFFLQYVTESGREMLVKVAEYVAVRNCDTCTDSTTLPKEYYTETLIYLFSIMSKKQQMEMWKEHPCHLFTSLLNWPWCGIFMETMEHKRQFLLVKHYPILLAKITNKILNGSKDQHYQKLFAALWQTVPAAHKDYVFELCIQRSSIMLFCLVKENISAVFQNMSHRKRMKMLFERDLGIWEYLIFCKDWETFRFFIESFSLSHRERIRFKKTFLHYITCPHFKQYSKNIEDAEACIQLLKIILQDFCSKKNCSDQALC